MESNYQVLVPYDELQRLLSAARRIEQLEARLKKQTDQMAALRSQYLDLLDAIQQIRDFVKD